jgi:hypothetical protein
MSFVPILGAAAFPSREFDALVDSIRLHSVLRPVLLRMTPDGYMIVHGERRWRAAQMADLQTIPALIVQDISRGESTSTDCAAPHVVPFQLDCPAGAAKTS